MRQRDSANAVPVWQTNSIRNAENCVFFKLCHYVLFSVALMVARHDALCILGRVYVVDVGKRMIRRLLITLCSSLTLTSPCFDYAT